MVPWPSGLGNGLQNHLHRFDPGRDLWNIKNKYWQTQSDTLV